MCLIECLFVLGSTAWDTKSKNLNIFIFVSFLTFMSYLNFFGLLEWDGNSFWMFKMCSVILEVKAVYVVEALNYNSYDNNELI